ncbi:MAG: hypothetical protein P8J32_08135 [bacterium]|nr:hypothetical protein [bacterium]
MEIGSQSREKQLATCKFWRKIQGYAFFVIVMGMILSGWAAFIAFVLGSSTFGPFLVFAGFCIILTEACNKWRRDLEDQIAKLEGRKICIRWSPNAP